MPWHTFCYLVPGTNKGEKRRQDEFDHKVDYYKNLDLEMVVTPVKADLFAQMLQMADYYFLHQGFVQGFDIGYDGPER